MEQLNKGYLLTIFKQLFEQPKKENGRLRQIKIGKFLFIEQNPDKPTKNGARAKAGEKIMWVIDEENYRYLMAVINGVLYPVKKNDSTN